LRTAPLGAAVYHRRQHVINLFVSQTSSTEQRPARIDTIQGFNIRHWSERGLNYWAVSDLAEDELADTGVAIAVIRNAAASVGIDLVIGGILFVMKSSHPIGYRIAKADKRRISSRCEKPCLKIPMA
jgi:hypothetical protein